MEKIRALSKNLPFQITLFLLFFLPFIVFPFEISPYEKPKVIAAEILILAQAVIFFKSSPLALKKLDKKFLTAIGLIVLLGLVHIIFKVTYTTLIGNAIRMQGVLLIWHLALFCVISAQINFPRFPPRAIVSSAVLLILSALMLNKNIDGRAVGTLGEPNALAATAIFIWPFIYFATRKLYLKIFAVFFVLLIAFLSDSKSALVALLIQFLLLFSNRLKIAPSRASLIGFTILLASLSLPFFEKVGIFENRAEIWKSAILAGFFNPLVGSGFGNTEFALQKAAAQLANNFLSYQFVDSAHNFLLDWWIQSGLIGLSLIIFLVFKTVKNFAQRSQITYLAAFLGIISVASFNPSSVVTLVAFWWLIGQSFSPKKLF